MSRYCFVSSEQLLNEERAIEAQRRNTAKRSPEQRVKAHLTRQGPIRPENKEEEEEEEEGEGGGGGKEEEEEEEYENRKTEPKKGGKKEEKK